MVPDHIQIRAKAHLPAVTMYSGRFMVDPELVLSIIHAESFFNPLAVSSCGAIGMMQIIPEQAGREAHLFVFGRDMLPSREYLFDPRSNIELGAAYLHLLKYRHFRDIPCEQKNAYLAICGYNWGPTSVRKNIVNIHPVISMTDEALYALLQNKTPHETRHYIRKVLERVPLYKALLEKN